MRHPKTKRIDENAPSDSCDPVKQDEMDAQLKQNTSDIKVLQNMLKKANKKKAGSEIYFDGQIYDAYSKILKIFRAAENTLTIVDSYAETTILDIVRRLDVEVNLITKEHNLLSNQDIKKYNRQYDNLHVYFDSSFHDRYFILDDQTVYHCGTSVNKVGYKTFSITLIGDPSVCKPLIERVDGIIAQAKAEQDGE